MNKHRLHSRAIVAGLIGACLARDASDRRTLAPADINGDKGLQRTFEVRAADEENRTVELSFSSELEYQRWFGIEILDHSAGAMRMDRLKSGAALLVNHDWDDQVGVVESVEIGDDRRGRAVVRFGRSARANEIFQDVVDGIRKLVSVGYRVHAAKLEETREGDVDVYRITDWEPYEISLVSVPADPSVGVGRSAEKTQEEHRPAPVENRRSSDIPPKGINTMEKILRDAAGNLVRAQVDDAGNIVKVLEVIERAGESARADQQRGQDAERARVRTITEMGTQYGQRDLAMEYIGSGKTAEEFQRALLDKLNERTARPLDEQNRAADIGLTDREVRQFSFMRAIRFLADPSNAQARKEAAFEIECSRAAADAYGKEAKGILVPADVLGRAFSTTTPSGAPGSNIVATELASGSFIEMLRKKSWVLKRARKLAGLVGNLDIPRQKSGTAAYWVGEGNAPTASEIGVDKINLNPKTLAAYSDITRRMLMQATPDAEALTRDDLLKSMSLEIDRAAIYGSGSGNQPKGLKAYTGINGVDFAATNPTFAELVQMETEISADNADVDSMSYAANAKFRGYAKSTLKFSAAGSATLWEEGGTVNGYACDISNQLIDGDVFFGNWSDLLVAMWGGLDITVDPYALSTSGGLRIITFQDVDVNIRHPESFCWGSSLVA
ncbi:hypothetical protein LMG31506_03008 [Cupriavidus yeoncheonensis]|uniref:Phage major capsid protein n=1 Tax=Cupriavidus yeoncheonensis TaxID=1462994 RepID=A0A916IUK3_9BURK|nr:phage major capsid protein [Cupriavidus yeoncheonensis]CAG2144452.1 hypothetical protein LMG31506_03008 [Cupriavidus yeoncheonensis]